tara:strand:- start:326 stop:601 length:276 start_codon:yes stop_codon:yes gene_type:complete
LRESRKKSFELTPQNHRHQPQILKKSINPNPTNFPNTSFPITYKKLSLSLPHLLFSFNPLLKKWFNEGVEFQIEFYQMIVMNVIIGTSIVV